MENKSYYHLGTWEDFRKEFEALYKKYGYTQAFACLTSPANKIESDHDIVWQTISEGQIQAIEESLELMKNELYGK